MIIIQLAGGLGNQLQQYALYRKFVSLEIDAKLDISWFKDLIIEDKDRKNTMTQRNLELDYFVGLSYKACTEKEKQALIGSDGLSGKIKRKIFPNSVHWFCESKMYHPEIFDFRDMYLSGYFACEKYYADILPDLRDEMQFPQAANPLNYKLADEMKGCQSASVHIRRGDYLSAENAKIFGNICTEAYYEEAIKEIENEVPDVQFFVFSDDIPYVKKKYQGDRYTIIDLNHGKDSLYDMWLMSNCRHNICANSTFSFWGARLNNYKDKIMIRPTVHKNGQVFVKEDMEEFWKGWRFVDAKGKRW